MSDLAKKLHLRALARLSLKRASKINLADAALDREAAAALILANARIARLEEALASAKAWHQSEDKALSKSGRMDHGCHWARCQHKEEISAICEVLTEAEDAAAWDRINARAALKGDA